MPLLNRRIRGSKNLARILNGGGSLMLLLIVAVLLVIAAALVDGGVDGGYEPGVRHELPAPHAPQCYAIIELGGGFCQFRL